MTVIDTDVLVVGLGPAGACAMHGAARQGLTVIGIERKQQIGIPVQCAEYIPEPLRGYANAPGVIVQEIGSMKTYLPESIPHQTHCQQADGHQDGHYQTDYRQRNYHRSKFKGLIIDRGRFDQHLVRRACQQGAVTWLRTHLRGLDIASRLATVNDKHGRVKQIRFRLLIACDGPRSKVAKLMGLPAITVLPTQQFRVTLLRPLRSSRVWLSSGYPGGYAWLFPRAGQANLGLGCLKSNANSIKIALQRLQRQLVEQGIVDTTILSRSGGPIPVAGIRSPLTRGPVMFAGDAAGLAHPISGAGIAPAVYSGEQAGLAALDYIRGVSVRGVGAAAMLAYEQSIHDCYAGSFELALAKRHALTRMWLSNRALAISGLRKNWIAFPEYYQNRVVV